EDRAPANTVDQPAAKHRTYGADHRAHRRPCADGAAALFAGEGFAEDCQAVRQQDGGAHALSAASGEQPKRTGSERTEERSERKDCDAEDQQSFAAEMVASGAA